MSVSNKRRAGAILRPRTLGPAIASLVFAAGVSVAATPTGVGVEGLALGTEKATSESLAPAAWAKLVGGDGKANIIVVFRGEPAAKVWAERMAAGGPGARSAARAATSSAIASMRNTQQDYLATMQNRGIEFDTLYTVQRTLNAVVLRAAPEKMDELRADPSVERVEFVPLQEPTHGISVPFLGAPLAWDNSIGLPAGVTGQGMRIGIIDTGVDYQHPNFGGSGVLADYQANNRTIITDLIGGNPSFPTARVVGGFDFAGDSYTGGNAPVPDPDPMDCNGHGTHVAGTAAGGGTTLAGTSYAGPYNSVTDYTTLRIGPGVAPQADIYALRVFGCGGSTGLTVQAIEWATDPNNDDDLSDRLDVINMSLGSNYGLPFDSTAVAADNATATGMIVVASAGNAADTAFISGSPGAGARVISVANSIDGRQNAVNLVITSPPAIAGTYAAAASAYTDSNGVPPPSGQSGSVVAVDDGNAAAGGGTATDGCETPFVNAAAINGNVALIDRGLCGFVQKVLNAQAAGATAVIVANNAVGDGVPPGMGGSTPSDITIPGVSISKATGDAIRAELGNGPVSILFAPATSADLLNAGSSRGPRGGGADFFLKPEVAAPGTNIVSAQTGVVCTGVAPSTGCISADGSGFIAGGASLSLTGTSMAAPHVAGVMALLREVNPTSTVQELKAMVMSSARHDVSVGANGGEPRFAASRVGAGRVDVPHALTADVYATVDADPAAVAVVFNGEPTAPGSATRVVRLVNRTSSLQNVTLAIDEVTDAPGIDFSIVGPTAIAIPANGSATTTIQLDVDPDEMDRFRDPAQSSVQSVTQPAGLAAQGNVARHFLTEESALLIVSIAASEAARLPLYTAQRPHATLAASPSQLPATPTSGTAQLTIAGTDVCTGTRAGGDCSGSFATDRVSLVSPFELGLQGAVNGAIPPYANIRYVGANYDPASNTFFFGVASHGEWATPGNVSYNICVDTNEDGNYDRVVFNSELGGLARLLTGQPFTGQDTYQTAVLTPPNTYSTGGAAGFLNLFNASLLDTALPDNEVMVLAATAAQLGLGASDRSFRYAVATCVGFFNPNCVRLTAPATCGAASAFQQLPGFAFYDGNLQGITSSGGSGGLPILIPAQDGDTLSLDFNLDNVQANGSDGILLLHHHNTSGTRAQVVGFTLTPLPDDMFEDGFEDQP